ncbi:extracellular solute-binding protein [Streptomyces sp. NPDC052107]|uniref:ABC transporter substrate-binding protein n=1 Tax=Streptomyces sp. NPDC052107 TaxID=3155632 RepID=UPI0034123E7E
MKRSRTLRLVTACTLGAITLTTAGCSGGSGGTGGSAGARELTYWSMWKEGEPAQIALQASIDQFTKRTGIKVNVQWQGRDVLTKLQPTLTGHPAADVFDRNLAQVKSMMVPTGTASDLSGLLGSKIPGEQATIADVVPPAYRTLGQANGKQVILPYNVVATSIWYNAARFPKLSSAAPTTWSAFQKLLDKQKAAGKAPLALDADIPDYNAYWYTSLVVSRLGAGSFHKAAGDKTGATWDQPGYLQTAQQVEKLAKGGYFAEGYKASKFPAIQQKWAANKADFIIMGSWLPSEAASYAANGFKYASFPIPGTGSAPSPVPATCYGWVVPSKAQHKSEAEKFISFMYGKQQMQALADKTSTISARQDVEPVPAVAGAAASLKANGTYETADAVNEDYAEWWTKVFEPLDDKLITGGINASSFISQLKSQSVDYWKRAQ